MASFEHVARLFAPVDGDADVVETGPRWSLDAARVRSPGRTVLWGRRPVVAADDLRSALATALRREGAVLRLRSRHRDARIWRIPPPVFPGPAHRRLARRLLLSGALVEVPASPRRTPRIEAVTADVSRRLDARVADLRIGRAGTAIAAVTGPSGRGLLRVGEPGTPADPSVALGVLELLAAHPLVPTALAHGRAAGLSWTVETRLEGSMPQRVGERTRYEVGRLLASLPRSTRPPTSFRDDLGTVAAALPDLASQVETIATRSAAVIGRLPSVPRHGDLSLVNLLTVGDRLTGLVDWENWHARGVPLVDLLQLHATADRASWARPLGERWLRRPWRDGGFLRVAAPVLRATGVDPAPDVLDAVGAAWWAQEIAFVVSRDVHRRTDRAWRARDVDPVVTALVGR